MLQDQHLKDLLRVVLSVEVYDALPKVFFGDELAVTSSTLPALVLQLRLFVPKLEVLWRDKKGWPSRPHFHNL